MRRIAPRVALLASRREIKVTIVLHAAYDACTKSRDRTRVVNETAEHYHVSLRTRAFRRSDDSDERTLTDTTDRCRIDATRSMIINAPRSFVRHSRCLFVRTIRSTNYARIYTTRSLKGETGAGRREIKMAAGDTQVLPQL